MEHGSATCGFGATGGSLVSVDKIQMETNHIFYSWPQHKGPAFNGFPVHVRQKTFDWIILIIKDNNMNMLIGL